MALGFPALFETRRGVRVYARRNLVALGLTALSVPAIGSSERATAEPLRVASVKRISGATPFPAGCNVPADQSRGAETGPVVAVNPANRRNLIATWEQDPSKNFRSLSVVVGTSSDGGETWKRLLLLAVSRCTGGEPSYASDPSLAIGPDGIAYLATLATGPGAVAVQVSRSANGGRSWGKAAIVAGGHERGVIAADPTKLGAAYLATSRSGTGGADMYVYRTADGGRTWSGPMTVPTPFGKSPMPDKLLALPDGALLLIYRQPNFSLTGPVDDFRGRLQGSAAPIMATRSTDQGKTWSSPVAISEIPAGDFPHDPEMGKPGEAQGKILATPLPTAAAAPDGTAYVAWSAITSTSASRILVSSSIDGGKTWGSPRPVVAISTQAFLPTLAVGADRTVALTWMDFRNDKTGDEALTTDVWLAHSHDEGTTWGLAHLAGPFDMRRAPEHGGHYVGFAQGLAALPGGFAAAFVQAPPPASDGPSDIFFARLAAREGKLRLSVRPRTARVGERTRFEFRVGTGSKGKRRPAAGATVRFAGSEARTDRRGRAAIVKRFRSPGRYRATVSKPGLRDGSAAVRVTR